MPKIDLTPQWALAKNKIDYIHTRIMRVGKTAKDKANGTQRFHKNRRVWDNGSRTWVKV